MSQNNEKYFNNLSDSNAVLSSRNNVMQLLFSLNMNNYSPVSLKSIAFKKFSKRHQQRVIKKNVADTINLIYLENQEFRKCQLLKCFEYNLAKFAVRKNPLSKSATQLEVGVIKVWLRRGPDREVFWGDG
ncbi:hypothetical protein RN001_005132 [Aquatica leii]|uniref:Uncharacterized protein n=1 Tax=Aquatica leii TaxID=1421715 RepID=A0AAN7PCE7_9COLE|nr:hypothetical protein RN001_005132 [Aquatica leii]